MIASCVLLARGPWCSELARLRCAFLVPMELILRWGELRSALLVRWGLSQRILQAHRHHLCASPVLRDVYSHCRGSSIVGSVCLVNIAIVKAGRLVCSVTLERMASNRLLHLHPGVGSVPQGSINHPLAARRVCCVQRAPAALKLLLLLQASVCSVLRVHTLIQLAPPSASCVARELSAQAWVQITRQHAARVLRATILRRSEQHRMWRALRAPLERTRGLQQPLSYLNARRARRVFTLERWGQQALLLAPLVLLGITHPPQGQHRSLHACSAAKGTLRLLPGPARAPRALLEQSAQTSELHPVRHVKAERTAPTPHLAPAIPAPQEHI
jgi:hypothetical protein